MRTPAPRPRLTARPRPFALVLLVLLAGLAAPTTEAQQVEERDKLAQSGMKFLSVSADPRAAALGGAVTAIEGSSSALFYNPAGMAWMEGSADAMLGQTGWIADIDYNHASVALRPANGRYGVFGLSLTAVDYGDLQETIFDPSSEQGFLDLGTFSPTAYAVGVGYARTVTDRFSVGGQVKYANQDFGSAVVSGDGAGSYTREDISEGVLAFDFGVLYKTPFRSLNFAVSARNFSQEASFAEESFQLPLTLQIGVAMDVVDLTALDPSMHRLVLAVDAEDPRDFSEQFEVGGEYTFANTLALRAGYVFPADEQSVSLGAGIRQRLGGVGFGADYSFSEFGVFSNVHRIAVKFNF